MSDNHPICGYREHHPQSDQMTDDDYRLLEMLLGKLAMRFRDKYAVSVTPNVVHDAYSIALYDRESGRHIDDGLGMDIKDAISKLKSKETHHEQHRI